MNPEIGITLQEVAGACVILIGAFWTLGSVAVREVKKNIDEKFKASAERQDSKFLSIDEKLKTFDALHTKLAAVDKDLVQVRLEMAQNFVRQEGLQRLQQRMEQLFTEVFDKLDSKADKSMCDKVHKG